MAIDITVRGAGVFGLSIAWACVQRGARVRIVDPNGVATGASGGIVGALAPHVPEQWNSKKAFQLESLLMANDWWAAVETTGGQPSGYGRTGRLQPLVEGGRALALARMESAKGLWQGRATWQVVPAHAGFAPPTDTGELIHDTLSGRIHPAQASAALVAALTAKGAEFAASAPDEGRTIWATGYEGLEALTKRHTRMVGAGIKGQAILLEYDARREPQLFIDGLHIIPHGDGTTAIGSTTERDWDSATTTDAQCDDLLARARAAVPILADAPEIMRWAGVRPRARTRAPMVGPHPFNAGAFIANGGFKIGFGMAPLVAEKLADLVLTGQDTLPPEFAPTASL